MTIKDGPEGRVAATAMRDLLRQLSREATANHPARPNPPSQTQLNRPLRRERDHLRVGSWVITDDPVSGDLVAIDRDGTAHTLIARGGS